MTRWECDDAVADQLSLRWDKPNGSGRVAKEEKSLPGVDHDVTEPGELKDSNRRCLAFYYR